MTQHGMRTIALQTLYLANQNPELNAQEASAQALESLDIKDFPDFSKQLIEGIIKNREKLDHEINEHLKKGWRLGRLSQVDRAILELGLYEIEYSDAIAPVAALDEALNLCEEFSAPESKSFINGVLGNFIK